MCCTDGLVLGPFPLQDFTMNLAISPRVGEPASNLGIDAFRIGSWSESTNDVSFVSSSLTDTLNVRVTGQTCSQFCAAFTNCGECNTRSAGDTRCGWCGATVSASTL